MVYPQFIARTSKFERGHIVISESLLEGRGINMLKTSTAEAIVSVGFYLSKA